MVRDFLALITETYIRFMRRWNEIVPVCSVPVRAYRGTGISSAALSGRALPVIQNHGQDAHATTTPDDVTTNYAVHWSMLHGGRIMVRNDASTNLSPAMYEEFARPYDQRLLDELGGGGIHFCGRGDHLIAKFSELSGLYAINATQPALNNVEALFVATVDKQINLLGFERDIASQAREQGRPLRGRVHCW